MAKAANSGSTQRQDKLQELRERKEALERETERVARLSHERAITKDGHAVGVFANLGHAAEAADALENGAEGVGLFRTEFLFLNRNDAPDEDEQFEALSELRGVMDQRPVIIRTLDVGGDKVAPSLGLPQGSKSLPRRACHSALPSRRELFRTHLRAILRAGHGGNFQIMFPMISEPQELRDALSELENAHAALESESKAHAWPIPVGIMIEVPSAATPDRPTRTNGRFLQHRNQRSHPVRCSQPIATTPTWRASRTPFTRLSSA